MPDPLNKYTTEHRRRVSLEVWARRSPEERRLHSAKCGLSRRGKCHSQETIAKLRKAHLGQIPWNKGRKETRIKVLQNLSQAIRNGMRKLWESSDSEILSQQSSELRKQEWQNPEIAERRIEGLRKYWANPKNRSAHLRRQRMLAKNPNWRGHIGRKKTAEEKEKIAHATQQRWQDPEYKERVSRKIQRAKRSKSGRMKAREGIKRALTDPEKREKLLRGSQASIKRRSPNKGEQILFEMLNRIQPELWEYTGGGDNATRINGHYPDFLSYRQKKIIELDGTYWHKDVSKDRKRNHAYRKVGYDVLSLRYGGSLTPKLGTLIERFCHA